MKKPIHSDTSSSDDIKVKIELPVLMISRPNNEIGAEYQKKS